MLDDLLWKDIPTLEGFYQAHPDGYVRSLPRHGKGYRILKGGKSGKERKYISFTLSINGLCITKKLHYLIAVTFIPNPNNKSQINHIDGDTFNNCITNLEWVTNLENQQHAHRNGLYNKAYESLKERNIGNNYSFYKTKYYNFINYILDIRELNVSCKYMSKKYSLSLGNLSSVINSKAKHTKGWMLLEE